MHVLICIFTLNLIFIFLCTCAFHFYLWLYFCATSYLPEKSVNVLCVFACTSFCLTLHLPKKFDCDKVNLVLSVITITVVLVKLSQMIWGYINICLVCQSVSGFVSFFGRYAFLIIIVLFHKNFVLVRHRVPVVAGS